MMLGLLFPRHVGATLGTFYFKAWLAPLMGDRLTAIKADAVPAGADTAASPPCLFLCPRGPALFLCLSLNFLRAPWMSPPVGPKSTA